MMHQPNRKRYVFHNFTRSRDTQSNISTQRLKSALWYSIGKYIDEECLTSDVNATPQFIGALTELVYTQIGTSHLYTLDTCTLAPHTIDYSNAHMFCSKHLPRPRNLLSTRRPQCDQYRRRDATCEEERCVGGDVEEGARCYQSRGGKR